MEKGPDGKYPYKGPVDCAMQTFTKEGPLKFYTGFPTYCIRCDRSIAAACMHGPCMCSSRPPWRSEGFADSCVTVAGLRLM